MKKKILVTGGAGYIGSHTAKALRRAGYRTVLYDIKTLKPASLVPRQRVIEVDERIGPDGEVIQALDESSAITVARALAVLLPAASNLAAWKMMS